MWVKICGNTRLEDCQHAAEAGADALGFVFAAGKRTVTPVQVAAITRALPEAVEKIGVFSTLDADEMLAAVEVAGLTGVQIHTAFDRGFAERVRKGLPAGGRLLQSLHWWTDLPARYQVERFGEEARRIADAGVADAILLDSRTREASGGTGIPLDWRAATEALRGIASRVVLAGGLRPENVAEAVDLLSPWGVDVSSGVESAPGVKDAVKVRAFVGNARR